jgi:hypothetical protein
MGFLDRMKASITRVHFTYLGGHPDISKQQVVGIEREGDNVNLYSPQKDDPIATIPLATIKSVKLERSGSRSLGKAAGGAIVGGALLGPVGAIAGGALGGRKKKESLIVLTVQQGPMELEVLLGGENTERNYPRFTQLLK